RHARETAHDERPVRPERAKRDEPSTEQKRPASLHVPERAGPAATEHEPQQQQRTYHQRRPPWRQRDQQERERDEYQQRRVKRPEEQRRDSQRYCCTPAAPTR